MAIRFATSHPFVFTPRNKILSLDILKFLVTTLRNNDRKFAFIRVDEYGSLEKPSELMKTFHNMDIIVQTKGGYASSLNGKIEIPHKTLANTTRSFPLKSINKK